MSAKNSLQVLHGMPCDDANFWHSTIKHGWLENRVLKGISENDREARENEVIDDWTVQNPIYDLEYSKRIRDAKTFLDKLEEGFSPKQLVDTLKPFSDLPESTKCDLRRAIHAVYLESSGIADFKTVLTKAVSRLRSEFDDFRKAWGQPDTVGAEQKVRTSWRVFRHSAEGLLKELENMPKGIQLP